MLHCVVVWCGLVVVCCCCVVFVLCGVVVMVGVSLAFCCVWLVCFGVWFAVFVVMCVLLRFDFEFDVDVM